jgi:carboxymethylenebutenolidase
VGAAVTLEASDGHRFDAYQAFPAGPARGGVVILQEIFGVNRHIRALVDEYAAAGYAAVAPAVFDRARRGVELGYTPEGTVEAAARALAARTGHAPAVIGFCWGGSLAWLTACRSDSVACAVGYYGGQITQFLPERPRVPVLLHFGERDALIPPGDVEAIRRAHPEVEVFVYPAGHGFNCTERADHDPVSSAAAGERTRAFLQQHLTSGSS